MIKFQLHDDEFDLPEGALRYAQRMLAALREAFAAADPAFRAYRVAYLDTDYLLARVLERLGARPWPVDLALPVARLSEDASIRRWVHRRIEHADDDRRLFSGAPLGLAVAGSPLVVVFDTVYNGMCFQGHVFVLFRDEAQLEALNELYARTAREILAAPGVMVDLGRGVTHPKPEASMDDVVLPPAMKRDLLANTAGFFESREAYRSLGLPWKRGVILAGPPGNGKTLFLKALARLLPHPFAFLRLEAGTHDSELVESFRRAQRIAPCTVVIEDLDRAAEARFNLSTLLNAIDGLEEIEGILLVATTNRPEAIDPALVARPSRFDRKYLFDLPAAAEKLALLVRLSRGRFSESALAREVADSEGFSMATTREAVVTALVRAACEKREAGDLDLAEAFRVMRGEVRASRDGMATADRGPKGFGGNGDGEAPMLRVQPALEGWGVL